MLIHRSMALAVMATDAARAAQEPCCDRCSPPLDQVVSCNGA